MNDLTIDLTNARIPEMKTTDPWREEVGIDTVTFTLDQPISPRGATCFTASFGPGFSRATLEAARATMRNIIADASVSEDSRIDRDAAALAEQEREEITQYALMRSVCVNPGMNFRALAEHMRANGWSGKDEEIRAAATALQTDDYGDVQPLVIEKGARNASNHHPGEGVTSDAWSEEERIASETGDTADDQEIEL